AGHVLYKARNYEKAMAVLSKAIELSPRDARAYSLRAACRTAVGDLAGAEADRRTAAELNARLQQARAASAPVPTVASAPWIGGGGGRWGRAWGGVAGG